MAKTSPGLRRHMESRLHAFKEGTMHSRKRRTGPVVKGRKQAVAIALSEARQKGLKGAPPELTDAVKVKRPDASGRY